jgi:6-phosphogluconolactonase (cycloisomerase 2 family)
MPMPSERNLRPWLRLLSVVAATALCFLLAGCGSSSSTPSPPPSPPAPLGHLYVTTASNLYGYAISSSNGSLSGITTPSGAPGGTAIASNTQKNLLYTLTSGGQISGYTLNRSDGSLTAISGAPWGGAGVGVAFLAVDTAGRYVFVPAAQDFNVVPYTIGSTGALTIGLQVGTPAAPLTATVDPLTHFLYVPMGSKGTELFQIANGALVDQGTIPPLTQGGAVSVAITPNDLFAYISDGLSGVAAYSINATTGNLTPLSSSPYTAGVGTSATAMTPNGTYLYVAASTGIAGFLINADGSLTSLGSPLSFATPPLAMSIDPTGGYLYATSNNSSYVTVLRIDPNNGTLSAQIPVVNIPATPTGLITTP